MKKSLAFAFFLSTLLPLPSLSSQSLEHPRAYKSEIEPYVAYLKHIAHVNPVDYVLRLFEKKDIVILCERDRREVSQYELIYSLVSDRRFIDKVGRIFTEIGSTSNNQRLDAFLKSDAAGTQVIESELLGIYRDLTWSFFWEYYDFYSFLESLRFLNVRLPPEKKLTLFFSDLPFDWEGMTKYRYQYVFTPALGGRDRSMAEFIIGKIQELEKNQTRKKYLVIMNYRHAFKNFDRSDNTAEYIYEKYPERTANVMLNALKPLPGSTDDNHSPVMDGKWDAAFRFLGNPNIGFDMKDSPFGRDPFDYYPYSRHNKTYQDVFDGFVFSMPLEKHILKWNIPGFVDESFLPELKARIAISSSLKIPENMTLEDFKNDFNAIRSMGYPDLELYDRAIRQWLLY